MQEVKFIKINRLGYSRMSYRNKYGDIALTNTIQCNKCKIFIKDKSLQNKCPHCENLLY